MIIAVISPQKRNAGATSIAALIGASLSKQNRSTLLLNTAAHSDSLNMYFGIHDVGDAPASQLLSLVKMGGAKKESIPNYCFSVNRSYDVFSVDESVKDKAAVDEVHEYLKNGAPYDYIVCDVDTAMDDERTAHVLSQADCVVVVLNSQIKNLVKFFEIKKDFVKLTKHKPVITVLNNYDQEICRKEDAAKIINVKNKATINRWCTVHTNRYIPYCENRGQLPLLFEEMGKRTSQTMMLATDTNNIIKQIIRIQTEISKHRIQMDTKTIRSDEIEE